MTCPYCKEEMELGYIQCRDGVSWSKRKRLVAALPALSQDSIPLASGGGPFSGASAPVYNCGRCKKMIIDYGGTSDLTLDK